LKTPGDDLNISEGLSIDSPAVSIPWSIYGTELKTLMGKNLRKVNAGYFTASVKIFGDLQCELGFHFSALGKLERFEFFRNNYDDQVMSYAKFQEVFEREFGKPNVSRKGDEGFNDCYWDIENIQIAHYVRNRFVLEEHMEIRWIGSKKGE
jgi:hypothetical protein